MHHHKPKFAFAILVLSAGLTGCVTGGNLTYKNGPPRDDQWFLKSLIWVAELGPQINKINRALTPAPPAKTTQALAFESKLAKESPEPDLAEYRRLRLNAFQGDAHAPNQVGELYLEGRGVTKNKIEAYAYFNFPRACDHAEANRQRLAGELSSEDKLRGQQRTIELQKELDWVR